LITCYRVDMATKEVHVRSPESPATEYVPIAWETRTEAAERARVSTKTLDNWVRSGRLPRHGAGRLVRFDPADVDALLRGEGR
jgi:excisionase family DNA binding protein